MSSDRKTLIRLASTLPKGSEERRTLLAELQKQSARPTPFPPGTPIQEKLECISKFLNDVGADRADYNHPWWEKAGVETCPVCGSTDTHVTDSLRFNEHRGRAVSECKNCDSDWLWEAEAKWVEGACRIKWVGNGKNFKGKPARGSVYESALSQGVTPDWCEGL